jgi:type VI secretion system protein VasD
MTRNGTLMSYLKLCIVGTLIVLLIGCQATRRTLNFDTTAELKLSAYQNVNPDRDGRSSPIVIRVFKLADARQFQREDFLNLYENAEDRLGNDLIDTVILKELAPGEDRIESLGLTEDVRYLGLLAEYVQYQDANAIVVLPVMDHSRNKFDVEARRLALVDSNASARRHSRNSQPDYDEMRRELNKLRSDRDAMESEINRYKK